MSDFSRAFALVGRIKEAIGNAHIVAGANLVASQVQRIHERGEATDGSQIGTYSEAAYFTSINRFVSEGGIPKDKISKNGRWVKLPEGYTSFRQYSGRQTNYVDLDYTSLLRQSYRFAPTVSGFQTGYDGKTNRESAGVTPIEKMRYAEKNFGKKIISPSDQEVRGIVMDYEEAIAKAIR